MPAISYEFYAGPVGGETTRINYVPNPNFESNTTGWAAAAVSLTRITTDARFNTACMQVTSTSASDTTARAAYDPNTFGVFPGQTWTASAYLKNTAGNSREHRLYIRWFDSSNNIIGSTFGSVTLAVGSAWTRVSVTGIAPPSTSHCDVSVYVQATNPSTSNVALVDAVMLEKSSSLGSYFDGSFADYWADYSVSSQSWESTTNNSVSTAVFSRLATRTNLVRNPSAETNATDWTTIGSSITTVARTTSQALFGTASIQGTATTAGNMRIATAPSYTAPPAIPVTVGVDYTASGYCRADSTTRSFDVLIEFFNSAGGTVSAPVSTAISNTNTGWTRHSVTATAPFGAVTARMSIRVLSVVIGEVHYFDGALFEASPTLGTYFDGTNQVAWTDHTDRTRNWNGTPDASTSTATWDVDLPPTLSNNLNFTITNGRQQVQDPFRSSTCTLTGRNISQVTGLNIGDTLFIRTATINGVSEQLTAYKGLIANITINYGITSNLDTWTIEAEDALALAGRSVSSPTFTAGETAFTCAVDTASIAGIDIIADPDGYGSTISDQTLVNENVLDTLNKLAATEQGRLVGIGSNDIAFYGRYSLNSAGSVGDFTDGTLTTTNPAKYDQITFRSRADSYYTKVLVEPAGLATQEAGTDARTFILQSYDETETQANDLANYVLATLQVSQGVPSTISYTSENQTLSFPISLAFSGLTGTSTIGVVLRGIRYSCFVEGAVISADPQQTRFTLYLSSADVAVGFVLDNTLLGVLDSSKLGF